MKTERERKPTFDPEYIRDLSVEVYKIRLRQEHAGKPDNVERMLAKDAQADPSDNGKKLRGRAGSYDALTRAYLEVLGISPPGVLPLTR